MKATNYLGALWVPAHASNFRRAGRASYTKVVIHCTDGRPDPHAVAEMWQAPNHGSSAHFVVGQDARVLQAVRVSDVAWHAHAQNGISVGVEHCARTPGELGKSDPGLKPSEGQLLASARLTAWLLKNVGLQPSRTTIVGHAECDPQTTHEDCPTGSGLDLDAYVGLVWSVFND